jgi:hypothetical protein
MKFTKQELWAWLKAEKHHTPDKDPVKPLHNRSSRRRQGQVRSAQRSARRRKLANAQRDRYPLPWRPPEPEEEADA